MTISVWIQTSPFGVPLGLLLDSRSAPPSPATAVARRPARVRAQTRWMAVRPAAAASRARPIRVRREDRRAGSRHRSAASSPATVSSNRAANCSACSTRRLSSRERRRIDDPQHAAREIGAPVERIDVLAGERVPRDRVDREVAAPCGLAHGHRGIALRRRNRCGRARPSTRVAAARRRRRATL